MSQYRFSKKLLIASCLNFFFSLGYLNTSIAMPVLHMSNPTYQPTAAPWGQVNSIYTINEVHLLQNWPTSATAPTANNTNCGNGVYIPGTMTLIGTESSNNTYFYNCAVTLTSYDKVVSSRWLAEQSSSSNGGWNSVTPANAPAGVTDLATFQFPNGYPTTTYQTRNAHSMGPQGYYSGCSSLSFILYPSGGSPVSATYSTSLNSSIWGVLTMTVYPGEQLSLQKEITGRNYSNITCITPAHTVTAAEIGKTNYIECCPTSNVSFASNIQSSGTFNLYTSSSPPYFGGSWCPTSLEASC